ncbi:MAG: trypsin-like peptidase domain-containing protein [Acidocella sp.]|uniref:trypsin-like peptidase domain-containing protein n=1 Tax=Acidocella sp. TaxID=50710 RepID=UPI003FC15DEE
MIFSVRLLCALFLLAGGAARAAEMPPSLDNLAAKVLPAVVSIAAMAPAGDNSSQGDNSQGDNGDSGGGGDNGDGGDNGGNGGADNSALHATADTPDNTAGTVVPPPKTVESLGSGFVFDPAGYILTNNHVVENANTVIVTFPDGTVYTATIAGRDKPADLAVLKIDAGHKLPYVKFGDSGKLRVGDWVLAVGNPFGLPGSSSAGIVSALHRDIGDTDFDDFIQTDAAINKGNSGGPLFNMAGEVIGVNSAIYAPSGTSDGVGFAIPSAMAEPVAEELAHSGYMTRGWLGLATEDVTPQVQASLHLPGTDGALIGSVSPGGPSDGTLRNGDVVTALAGVNVANPRELQIRTAEIPAGQTVSVQYWRDGSAAQAKLTIAAPPAALDETVAQPTPGPIALQGLGLSVAAKPAENGVGVLAATGPAATAGMVPGDVIEQVNGQAVASAAELQERLKALAGQPPVFLVSGNAADGTNPGPRWVPVQPAS